MDRRTFLNTTTVLGAGALLGMGALRWPPDVGIAERTASSGVDGESLAIRAERKGLLYGAAVNWSRLLDDPAYAQAIIDECGILVPENELKWSRIRPGPATFEFHAADGLIGFAEEHGLRFRGHPLVWHAALPPWFHEVVGPANAEAILVDHISRVCTRYSGRVHSWDVVNEAIYPAHGRADRMRVSPWLEFLGPDYVELAFYAAAEADPDAVLVYNDTRVDYATPEHAARREGVLRLLENLVASNVPIHALGIQAHLWGHESRFDPDAFTSFLRAVGDLGLDIYITEMDVTDQRLPGDITRRDQLVAKVYRDYLDAVLAVESVKVIMTWGLSDRYTWLKGTRPRRDGRAVRPLPLDDRMVRKPAWAAIAAAFDAARPR